MKDLVHMFGVIEGSARKDEGSSAGCVNQKVRQEAVERTYGDLEVVWSVSSPECWHIMIPGCPIFEKYYYDLYAKIDSCPGILLL